MILRRDDVIKVLIERLRNQAPITSTDIESVADAIIGLVKPDDLGVDPYSVEQETRFRALKEASGVLTPTYGLAAALSPSPERQRAKALVETVDWVLHGPKENEQ
jgi:hypothetical protein